MTGTIRSAALLAGMALLTGCPVPHEAAAPVHESAAPARESAALAPMAVQGAPVTVVAGTNAQLTLDTRPVSATLAQGDPYVVRLNGHATAGGAPIYVQVQDATGAFALPQPAAPDRFGTYRIGVALKATLAPGRYTGTLALRACADRACSQQYATPAAGLVYTIDITAVADWQTQQRDAAHDGYVPITLDPARFVKAWEWTRPTAGTLGALNPVVVSDGRVFATDDDYFSSPSAYALRASDGVPVWRRQFTDVSSLSPPTVANGSVYFTAVMANSSSLYAVQAANGFTRLQMPFYTQWANLYAPTVTGSHVLINASGAEYNTIQSRDTTTGSLEWSTWGGTYDSQSVATDGARVYGYDGTSLNIRDVATGADVGNIGPRTYGMHDFHGMPMLGSADHVIAYNGNAWSGRASNMTEPWEARQLVDYSVSMLAPRWMTIGLYNTEPATAKGVVYAATNETGTFDAIDEATGQVLWSWHPPENNVQFHRNIVVTNNLAFVSTTWWLYAIDLRTHRMVWRANTPGHLTLSSNRMLYVVVSQMSYDTDLMRSLTGRLVAYRLY